MKLYNKWVLKNCPTLEKETIIVTGASGSLGYYVCYYSLLLGANLILAVRNLEYGEDTRKKLLEKFPKASIIVKYIDLDKFDTIKPFVDTVKNYHPTMLFNNAGVYHLSPTYNSNNVEITFMTNYLGPHILTELLLPYFKKNNGKIINQVSISANYFKNIDFNDLYSLKNKGLTQRYSRTKKMIIYDSLRQIRNGNNVVFAHPGASATKLFSSDKGGFSKAFDFFILPLMKFIFLSPSKASLSDIYAITHKIDYGYWVAPRGLFEVWGYPKVIPIKKVFLDTKIQDELYIKTNDLIKEMEGVK